ncbi:MAG: Ohr family peroxiredoxin, partial [Clostridia bacterium]
EMGGKKADGVNPEQLFAAGYAACFGSALQHVVRTKKLAIPVPTVKLTVGMGKNDTGGFALAVNILATFKDILLAEAEALVQEAHQVCPYSNATRGNIAVVLAAEVN